MKSSFVATSLKVTALLVFLVGLASQKHAVTSFVGDRATFKTTIVSCFNRIGVKDLDSGGPSDFTLSENEWKVFKVFQDADSTCSCTVTCEDANARIDMYMTFERGPRLSDNWDGWVCRETLAFNTQSCIEAVPGPDSTCRLAVRGDTFARNHSPCSVTCTVDTA
jgi:hypothetical protein